MKRTIFSLLSICLLLIHCSSNVFAQEERKLSVTAFGGISFFPKTSLNPADLPTRVLGGFNPTPLVGLGLYYKLSKNLKLGEHYLYQFNTRSNNKTLSTQTFRTVLKYSFVKDKKISPYLMAGININRVSLSRASSDRSFVPDPANSSNVIGPGIGVDSIQYREKELKLSGLPVFGASIGLGFDFKITKKINAFIEYDIHANQGKNNRLIEQYYFSNESNFLFHTVNAGINMKLFKPQKQLLAKLPMEDWKNSFSVDVRGTMVYKKPNKPANKSLEVELTDTLADPLRILQTDANGVFFMTKEIEMGDYQFMLPKKNRKILRADLLILNYNRIKIEDDDLELEMLEDELSENILSRDGNFAVMLREGFQHEIELSTTAQNIMGKFIPLDNNCRVRIILKDQYDSVVAYIDTANLSKDFNFIDINPGNYKLTFQKMNEACNPTEFNYSFLGYPPTIRKQSNINLPLDTVTNYSIKGAISSSPTKQEAPKGTVVRLVDPSGRVEAFNDVAGVTNSFFYSNLKSPKYTAVFEDPTNKGFMNYKLKDKKAIVIKEVSTGPSPSFSKKNTPTSKPISVKGKLELVSPEQAKDITLLLIDSTGKIKQKLPLSSDGTFIIDNLEKNNYKIAYQSMDPLVRGKLSYKSYDKSLKINKVVREELSSIITDFDTVHFYKKDPSKLEPTTISQPTLKPIENKEPLNPSIQSPDIVEKPIENREPKQTQSIVKNPIGEEKPTETIPKKPVEPTPNHKYPFNQFVGMNTYTDKGHLVKPDGYGVQVASFFVVSNLEKFCGHLRTKGHKDIFIQVVPKDRNNPEAGLIYRVIVSAGEDRETALRKVPTIVDDGYDAVLRKHLD